MSRPPAVDVLDVGPRGPRLGRRARARVVVATVVLLAGLGAGWRADRAARAREFDAVLSCARQGVSAVAIARRRVFVMRAYVSPVLASSTDATTLRGMHALVRSAAADEVPRLRRAAQRCADVPVLSWHQDLDLAARASAAHITAWTAFLQALAADDVRPGADPAKPAELAEQARRALLAAAPDREDELRVEAVLPGQP